MVLVVDGRVQADIAQHRRGTLMPTCRQYVLLLLIIGTTVIGWAVMSTAEAHATCWPHHCPPAKHRIICDRNGCWCNPCGRYRYWWNPWNRRPVCPPPIWWGGAAYGKQGHDSSDEQRVFDATIDSVG